MSTTGAGTKAGRKFPPPCWTRDEALVLIEAYRVRWHALNRAFLRNPDWDAVAETVTTSCPDVTPPKTSAQCRHKMEKLRQRHRAEKERAAAFPGERYNSTWFYYEAMEAMENGSKYEPGVNQVSNPGQGMRVKPLAVQNLPALPPNSTKQRTKPNPNPNSNVSIRHNSYPSNRIDNVDDHEQRSIAEAPIEETLIPTGYRGRGSQNHLSETLAKGAKNPKRSSIGSGITVKPSTKPSIKPSITNQEPGRPGLRPRKFSKVVHDNSDEEDDEMWVKVPRVSSIPRGKLPNGNGSGSGPNGKNGKNVKKGKKNDGGIKDVVASIRLLGEGFMKVETMKMDMVMEIEEMRMQTEMKRNELMIESQKQIVQAFVQGLIESRKMATTMGSM